MILHCVYLRLQAEDASSELAATMDGLNRFCDGLPGCRAFQHGPNRDMEGKSPDFPYGFVATFQDAEALENYARHPEHKALGARLVALCEGGAKGIMVYDLDVEAA